MTAPLTGWSAHLDRIQGAAQEAFSRDAVFRPASGGEHAIRGIFDRDHQVVQLEGDEQVSSAQPVLEVRLSELPAEPLQGDVFEVDGDAFEAVDVQKDGRGSAKILMVLL